MKITAAMNLNDLAERMGSEATTEDAERMRDLLASTSHSTTEEIPEREWLQMLDLASNQPGPGEYEIFRAESNDHTRTLLTGSRGEAVAEVARLLDEGTLPTDIYATYDRGLNFGQARAHLLLPDQQ